MNSNGFQQSAYNKYAFSPSVEVELGTDIAKTGNIFMSDPKKHEDLKIMLESNKDSLKLEAMKRIISMVAKGRECGELFPSVVKNVVSKNAEVKKLVYAYLTRYAEEQQDLALLSISTFQRALKDPNQLIRGSALRVLSSIRVPMIVPIMMLAIKDCVMDMSPYVRKIAAHAIPKLYSLDCGMKDQLIEVIEKLLADKTTLVAGSAIQSFEEVCPDRFDLIHKHYRKLCSLLVDVEEWGQVVIINMLTRYARTQFLDPNNLDVSEITDKKFYSEEESSSSSDDDDTKMSKKAKGGNKTMDPDHRLLISSSRTLLHSRNPAVVMSIAQLFYHCAPKPEMNVVVRSLIRLLRCEKEVQFVVLNNIATMSIHQPDIFQGYIKSFYVYNSDSTQIKLLKLEILTNLASESNISVILRELQNYIGNTDQEFVTATIQAIGRCASNITEVSDNCLAGLVQLISRKDENIVAEAIVVIRKLLQMQTSDHRDIIINMALLLDTINVPMAKASILWLIGEYCDRVPKIAPDVLRKAAKTFVDEKDIVKLQTINLAAKLYITNAKQTRLLAQYVLNLAKYDLSYDIRDRARFVRALLFPQVQENKDDPATTTNNGSVTFLSKRVKKIFLATKPAPLLQSKYKDRHNFQLGTMSHILNHRVVGYKDLPEWPSVAPDPSVRTVPEVSDYTPNTVGGLLASEPRKGKKGGTKAFYSDDGDSESSSESNSSSSETESDKNEDGEEDVEENDSDQSSSGSSGSSEEDQSPHKEKMESLAISTTTNVTPIIKAKDTNDTVEMHVSDKESRDSQSDSSEDSSTSSSSSDDDSDNATPKTVALPPTTATKKKVTKKGVPSNDSMSKNMIAPDIDLLLDFDEPTTGGTTSNMTSSFSSVPLTPSIMDKIIGDNSPSSVPSRNDEIYMPSDIPVKDIEILSKFMNGFIVVHCQFSRSLSTIINNPKLVSVTLIITNISNDVLNDVHVSKSPDVETSSKIDTLLPGKTVTMTLGIDFKDSTQPIPIIVEFYTILNCNSSDQGKGNLKSREQTKQIELKVKAPIGELLQPINMTDKEFILQQSKLRGMNESSFTLPLKGPLLSSLTEYMKIISQAIYCTANIVTVATRREEHSLLMKYAGSSCSNQLPCLIEVTVDLQESRNHCKVKVHSEQITLVSQLAQELRDSVKVLLDI